ncbi:hypothetical protein J7K19_08865 [bacterium]|nr:hypothetical protein [bacterium]
MKISNIKMQIKEMVEKGIPPNDILIIDSHAHLTGWGKSGLHKRIFGYYKWANNELTPRREKIFR